MLQRRKHLYQTNRLIEEMSQKNIALYMHSYKDIIKQMEQDYMEPIEVLQQ